MKRLNPAALMRRADEKARALGKTLTEGARKTALRLPRPGPPPDDERDLEAGRVRRR